MKKQLLSFAALSLVATAANAQYCEAVGPTSTFDTNVEAVELAGATTDISFTGTCPGITGLEDQTAMLADLEPGVEYTIDVTWGSCGGSYSNSGSVWIDYNGDMTFEDTEVIGTVSYGGGTNLQSYTFTVPVDAAIGSTRMRVMQHEGGSLPLDPCATYSWGSVTDFTIHIGEPITCPIITDLTVDAVTTTSADISWTVGGAETEWEVDYGLDGFVVGEGAPFITASTMETLTGLDANTEYDVYVRGICGPGDTSAWVGPLNVLTPCEAIAPAFFCEGFEAESETEACWTVLDANDDGDAFDINYTSSPYTGLEAAVLYTDFNAGANDDWLITPNVTLTGNEVIRYFSRVQSSFEPNDFEVLLSTTGKMPADFTDTLLALASYDNTEYEETIIDLSAYTGDVYIAFHVPTGGLDGWRLYFDDICFDICHPAEGVDGSADVCIADGAIDLDGVITPGEDFGAWNYDPNPTILDSSSFNFGGLAVGSYDVLYVVDAACSSDTTIATINVFDAPNAGEGASITVCKNQPFDLLSGLTGTVDLGGVWANEAAEELAGSAVNGIAEEGTFNYTYTVSNGVCEDVATTVEVIVEACDYLSIDGNELQNVTVYPNPTQDVINIVANGNYNYQVTDLTGRVIFSNSELVNGTVQIDLSSEEAGIYLIRIYNDNAENIVKAVLK